MLRYTGGKVNIGARRTGRLKRIFFVFSCIGMLAVLSSCAFLTQRMDSRTGFSGHLAQTEQNIRRAEWQQASINLAAAQQAWRQLKPILQVDIDHDYIKEIEDNFTRLAGHIELQDQAQALPAILLLEHTWKNIDTL